MICAEAESVLRVDNICCEKCCFMWFCICPAESSGILNLPLNKDPLYKDAFAMEHWLSLSKDSSGRRLLSKLRMGSQISCRNGST